MKNLVKQFITLQSKYLHILKASFAFIYWVYKGFVKPKINKIFIELNDFITRP